MSNSYTFDMSKKKKRHTLRLDPEGRGYRIDGELVGGFAPRPGLTPRQRLRLAQWAKLIDPESLSAAQRKLLAESEARGRSRAWVEAMDNRDELASGPVRAVWRQLSEKQRRLVLTPEDAGCSYPFGVAEMERLTGASARQIVHWARQGLLPHYRDEDAPKDAFRFRSAALVLAFALADAERTDKAVLAKVARGEGESVLALLAATFEIAARRQAEETPRAREDLLEAVDDLDRATTTFLERAQDLSNLTHRTTASGGRP